MAAALVGVGVGASLLAVPGPVSPLFFNMRTTVCRLAESISKRPLNLRDACAALLPPIPCVIQRAAHILPDLDFLRLYRRILRTHRHLPVEMRSLGDDYVKAGSCSLVSCSRPSPLTRSLAFLEFRRHKDVTNPGYIIRFLSQWKVYLDQMPMGSEAERFRGKKLDPTIFEKVRSELHNISWSADGS